MEWILHKGVEIEIDESVKRVNFHVSGANLSVGIKQTGRCSTVTAACWEEAGGMGLGDVAISAERVTITRTPMGSEAVRYFRACAQQSHHLHGTHSRQNKLSLGGALYTDQSVWDHFE